MAENLFIVQTTAGATFLGAENTVPVRVNNKVYTSKNVIDLRPGDIVLYEKEYVQTDFRKLEPYIREESPRYEYAIRMLFEENPQGQLIPRLRADLWRGINPNQNLEDKILKYEGQDFSNEEYNRAVEVVYNLIGGENAPIKRDAIKLWLEGEVRAPLHKRLYLDLSQLNPNFKDWYNSFHPQGPACHYYTLWKVIHQGVSRYLAARKGVYTEPSGKDVQKGEPEFPLSLKLELKAVMKRVIGEVNDKFDFARVTEVRRISRSKSHAQHNYSKLEPRLRQGVYHDIKPPAPDIKIKDLRQLRIDQISIEGLVIKCIRDYLAKKPRQRLETTYPTLLADIDNLIFHHMTGNKLYLQMIDSNEKELGVARKLAKEFMEDLRTGEVEQIVDLPAGTLVEAADTLKSINKNMPKELFDFFILKKRLENAQLRSPRFVGSDFHKEYRRYRKLTKTLKREYGFEDVAQHEANELVVEIVGWARQTFKMDKTFVPEAITNADIAQSLQDYGLEDLRKYVDNLSFNDYTIRLGHILDVDKTIVKMSLFPRQDSFK